jgi:hypothetical protein
MGVSVMPDSERELSLAFQATLPLKVRPKGHMFDERLLLCSSMIEGIMSCPGKDEGRSDEASRVY